MSWTGLPKVDLDGTDWPLEFAATYLDVPLKDLKELVRITSLPPSGTAGYSSYRRSGRQPRVYPASRLIELCEAIYRLKEGWARADPRRGRLTS